METQDSCLNNADDNSETIVETLNEDKDNETQETHRIKRKPILSRQQSKQEKSKESQSAASTLMKYIMEKNEKKEISQTVHPVDAFLNGFAPTLKNLSPYSLNIAKSKIFSIVQEIELNEIMEQQRQSQTYTYNNRNFSSTGNYNSATPSPTFATSPSSMHALSHSPLTSAPSSSTSSEYFTFPPPLQPCQPNTQHSSSETAEY